MDRMNELSEVFSGNKPLTRIEKNGKRLLTFRSLLYDFEYFTGNFQSQKSYKLGSRK